MACTCSCVPGEGARSGIFFAELAESYLNDYAKLYKRSWKEDDRRIRAELLPAFGGLDLLHIRRIDIVRLHTLIGRRAQYEANRVIELFHKMFEVARDWELVPFETPNPARNLKKFDEFSRERWIDEQEIPRLITAIGRIRDKYVRTALLLLLFTALRKNELLGLRWTDIDWSTDQITVERSRTKAKRTYYVPITPMVKALLLKLPQDMGPFVFPSRTKRGHLRRIEKSWDKVRALSGLDDIRLHDLRRTAGSWLANQGVDIHVIQKLLNHADLSATLIYARLQTKPVRRALEAYNQKLSEVADLRWLANT